MATSQDRSNKKMTMAELLAGQPQKNSFSLTRGQEVEGIVVDILSQEVILDLGTKAEGVLYKKELGSKEQETLKIGDKIQAIVVAPENESGQVILTLQKPTTQTTKNPKWDKFQTLLESGETIRGKGLEVNKGGLIVEVQGVRGFLPASQIGSSQASELEDLIGRDISLVVIEIEPNQNRLILSQKTNVTEDAKDKLGKLNIGDKVTGKVAAVLPFGIFISLDNGIEGLVHISEISWEKVEDPTKIFKIGDIVAAQVISIDQVSGRVNLSLKQLLNDPFIEASKKYNQDDVVKGTITKITSMGAYIQLENGVEGIMPTSKFEQGSTPKVGDTITCMIDSIDSQKRKITLVPFITSTSTLIYK